MSPLTLHPPLAAAVTGFTAIIPSVCVGNVGQLATDLVLASAAAPRRVSAVSHPALLPVVGADPIDETDNDRLMTACEVFRNDEKKLLVFQIRSGINAQGKDDFVAALVDWCKVENVSELIVLTSSSAEERIDEQLTGPQFRYLSTIEEEKFRKLDWIQLEKRKRFPGLEHGKEVGAADAIFLPGGGFAKSLYLKCEEEGVCTTVLVRFCSEGDNTGEATDLALYLNRWKRLFPVAADKNPPLDYPVSWRHLFGNPVPASIY